MKVTNFRSHISFLLNSSALLTGDAGKGKSETHKKFYERKELPFTKGACWHRKETKIGYKNYYYIHQTPKALTTIAKNISAI